MIGNKYLYAMKRLIFLAFAAFVFAACTEDVIDEQGIQPIVDAAPETLAVGFEENNTRVQLNEATKTVWTKDDLVSVFYRSNANQKWQYQGETGERVGNLKCVDAGTETRDMDRVVVVYPYNEDYYINPSTFKVQATLPATQTYLKGSYGVGCNLMVSQGEFTQFSLKSVCGWLKLQLTGNGKIVKSIKFCGNNGEQVAGLIYIDTDTAESTLALEMGDNGGGNLIFDDAILTEVTLDCGEGVTLGAEATAFYIALPPQTFTEGFTVEVNCAGYKPMTISTSNKVVIERNHIQPMAAKEHDAQVQVPDNEIWYTSTDGEVVVPYKTDVFGANIVSNTYENGQGVITFDGCVTKIGSFAFQNCSSLTSVIIPNSVTSIGHSAFYECSSLASVTIPDSVTSIDSAFWGCASLTSVIIPDSVTSIGSYAFWGCSSLASVTIGNSVTSIKASTFKGCISLTSVTIPDSVTSIEDEAFVECSQLTSFYGKFASADNRCLVVDGRLTSFAPAGLTEYTIPDSVTSIGEYAFCKCSSLTRVIIPNSVTLIGDYAFENCSSLKSVTIGNGVTSIGRMAFAYCRSLTSVTIPDSVTSIGIRTFDSCRSLVSVTIGNSVTSIGNYAFSDCSSLTAFYGKFASTDNRSLIVDGILFSCAPAGLTEYTIPDSVTSIGTSAFYHCSSLTSVTIPDSVTSIGNSAFWGCKILTSITIPNGVTSIGNDAFRHCSSLTRVYSKSITPPVVGSNMLANTASDPKIYVPSQSVDAYMAADGWNEYADSIIPYDFENEVPAFANNKIWYTSSDGNIVTPYKTDVFGASIFSNTYENGQGIITFEGDVTVIGDYAFHDCSSLTSVTIPDGVTSIADCAFYGCSSLASVIIPDSVTSIGGDAFRYCNGLTSVTIPGSVTSLEAPAFSQCSNLTTFYGKFASTDNRCLVVDGMLNSFAPSGLTEYTIPYGVTSIGDYAFRYYAGLTSITIPDSVTSIGTYAFQGCIGLTSMTIPDSVTSIASRAFYGCSSLTSVTVGKGVTSIEAHTFTECSSLTSVTIPDSVTSIEAYAFYKCSALASVIIPDRVTLIGNYAFSFCGSLVNVTIPDSVTLIRPFAFYKCSALASVTIGNGVTSIAARAFNGCSSLTSLYCKPTTPPAGGTGMLAGTASDLKIYVPTASVEAYRSASGWSEYADYIEGYDF